MTARTRLLPVAVMLAAVLATAVASPTIVMWIHGLDLDNFFPFLQ